MGANVWADLGLVLVGVVAGAAGSVVTPRLTNHFFGPKLDVTITDDEECNTTTTLTDASGNYVAHARYVRVKVTNTGHSTAKNCVAYLSDVEFLDAPTAPTERYVDTIRLSWTGSQAHAPIDLPPHISDYANVVSARSGSEDLHPELEVPLNRYAALWQKKGRIRFTVS